MSVLATVAGRWVGVKYAYQLVVTGDAPLFDLALGPHRMENVGPVSCVQEVRLGALHHHVRVEPELHELLAVKGGLHDDALHRLAAPGLGEQEVSVASDRELRAVRSGQD